MFITIYLIISNLAQEIRLLISILGSFSLLTPFMWDGIFDSWFATYIFFPRNWWYAVTWTCVKYWILILWVPHFVKGQRAYCWSTSVTDAENLLCDIVWELVFNLCTFKIPNPTHKPRPFQNIVEEWKPACDFAPWGQLFALYNKHKHYWELYSNHITVIGDNIQGRFSSGRKL